MSDAVQRWSYRTTDADEGVEVLRAQYAEHRPRFSGNTDGFELRIHRAAADSRNGRFIVDDVRHTMRTVARAEPPDTLMAVLPLSGWSHLRCRRSEASATMLVPTSSNYHVDWDDLHVVNVQIDLAGVQRIGAEHAGIDAAAVRFTGMNPISADRARYLRSVITHIRSDRMTDEIMANPLLRADTFRTLATALLATFPNTTHGIDARDRHRRTAPSALRRAQAFIDTYAGEDIDLTAIAEAARTSPHDLEQAFRTTLDCTAWQWIDRIRMERAHRDLQAADPTQGDTVAGIARRWGFAHPGGFSADYQHTYRRPPDDTLST